MALILPVEGAQPKRGDDCFLAPNCTVVGDVEMGNQCSIWFNAVVRGDVNSIRMGNKVNVQDGAVIHCTFKRTKTDIGHNVSIGHNAIVHGCTVHDNVLIGMGAIVMDNAVVHSNTIIAAGAVVLQGTVCEENSVYAGVPAKKVKAISAEKVEGEIARIANNYVGYAAWFSAVNVANPEKNESTFSVPSKRIKMKAIRSLLPLLALTLLTSCSVWNKVFPPKYGCGTDGRNVGAEKLLDETGKKKKEPKFRG